jgi:predicted  nucleic acid-binding Zn-ribbon protein
MPNIASALKAEISRIARKEIRADSASLKKAVSAYRSEIAALKRRVQSLEKQLRGFSKSRREAVAPLGEEASSPALRFSAKGLGAQRRRLGISARDR